MKRTPITRPPAERRACEPRAVQAGQEQHCAGTSKPLKLSANESHHGPSPLAIEAYRQCAGSLLRYPDGAQNELRQAIAETFELDAANIICGNGSDELQQLLIRAYTRPGDEIVFSRFSFTMAMVHATAQGARVVIAEEPQLRPDANSLLKAVTRTHTHDDAGFAEQSGRPLHAARGAPASVSSSAVAHHAGGRQRVCGLRGSGRFRCRRFHRSGRHPTP